MLIVAALVALAPVQRPPLAPPPRDARGWVPRHTFTHKAPVTAVAATADGYVTGDKDGVVVVWNAKTGKPRETILDGTNELIKGIDLISPTPDGTRLTIVSANRVFAHQWVLAGKDRGLYGPLVGLRPLAIRRDGSWLVTRTPDQANVGVFVVDFQIGGGFSYGGSEPFTHEAAVRFAASNDGAVVLTSDVKGVVRRWRWPVADNLTDPVWTADMNGFDPTALAVAPDGTMVAVAGGRGRVEVLDARRGKPVATLKGHTGDVRCVAFAPDSGLIATGGADGTVRLWNPWTGEQEHRLAGHSGPVAAVGFASDEVLMTASDDRTARVWAYKP